MLFFTSDLHLGHENAIAFTDRPFANVEEMNDCLIQNINETVGVKDELWILGDFAYKTSREDVRRFRDQIRCRQVHLVTGNHDKDYSGDRIFQSVQSYKELKTDYGRFILFHYPLVEWNAAHYGAVHLHGHIHSTGSYNAENLQKKYCDRFPWGHKSGIEGLGLRIYDVGVDANAYKPISLERLVDLMKLEPVKMRKADQ
ncbi:MAG: metallophosphoesterase family protein [Lachnospiraceae bacterium]|nr:metallophosphoesterase family protein [Lachnospiraceae bacterium]